MDSKHSRYQETAPLLPEIHVAFEQVPRLSLQFRLRCLRLCGVIAFVGFIIGGCATSVPDAATSGYVQVLRLAEATQKGGDYASALTFYEQAHGMAPDQPEPLLGIGGTAAAMGASRTAAEAYERALRLRPQDAAARIGYGMVLLDLDEPEAAVEQCREGLRLGAREPRVFNALGIALDLLGGHGEAQNAYRQGIDQEAENVALRNNLALSLALDGQYEDAIEKLRSLVRDPGAGGRIRQNLALVYALAGQAQDAAVVARQDLSEHEVANNLAFYESLRTLSGRPLAEAVFRGQIGNAQLQLQQEIPPAAF